jgi:hypothetical protein
MNAAVLAVVAMLAAIIALSGATAANDPGHDTLYVLRLGDNVTGSFNISGNITATLVQATSRFFGPNIDIRGDGTSSAAATRIIGTTTDLELATASGGIVLEKDGGFVQIGTVSTPANLRVNGSIYQSGVLVCLADGTNCPVIGGSSSAGGWVNGSSDTNTSLIVRVKNNLTVYNITGGEWRGNAIADTYVSSASTWNAKAGAGTCAAGFAVQNTTSGGVQCVTVGTGSGTVSTGAASKLAYYASGGTTVDDLAGANNGAIYYDGSGNVQSGTLPVASGGTGTTTGTGSGSVTLNNSPLINTPTITGTGSITASTGAFTTLTRGGQNVCTADGTNCPGGATGYTQWRIGNNGNVSAVSNNTIVNITAGAGISVVQVGTGPINITITNTGDTSSADDLTLAAIATNIGNFSTNNATIWTAITNLQTANNTLNSTAINHATAIANLQTANTTANTTNTNQNTAIANLQTANSTLNASITAKASPGTCAAGTVAQNTTTSGVQCVAITTGYQSSAGGWTNTTAETSTILKVNINSSSDTGSLVVGNATSTNLFVNGSSGNVGIGTAAPGALFEVTKTATLPVYLRWDEGSSAALTIRRDSTSTTSNAPLVIANRGVSVTGNLATIDFQMNYGAGTGVTAGRVGVVTENNWNGAANRDSAMFFSTTADGFEKAWLHITSAGLVGIGTDTPAQKLDVNGSGNFSGTDAQVWINGSLVCTAANGLCGSGSGITGSGTTGTIPVFVTNTTNIGNSILSQSGNTLTVGGNISMPTNFWIGSGATASGTRATAIGNGASVTADDGIGLGTTANVTGARSIAIGPDAQVTGLWAVAIGDTARARQADDIAIGDTARAEGTYSMAIGAGTKANASSSIAIGKSTHSNGTSSISIGTNAQAKGNDSIAIGNLTRAFYNNSVALGPQATTTGMNQLVIGSAAVNLNTQVYGILNTSLNLYENNSRVCTAANGLCGGGGSSGGWTNTTTVSWNNLRVIVNSSSTLGSFIIKNQTGSTHLFINGSSGVVGIGTSNPGTGTTGISGQLEVWTSSSGNIVNAMYDYNADTSPDATIGLAADSSGTGISTTGSPLRFMTGASVGYIGTEWMRLTTEGNLGIGTAGPLTNLHINESNTDTTPALRIEQASTGDAAALFTIAGRSFAMGIDNSDTDKFKISTSASTGGAAFGTGDLLTIDTSGNVGIGSAAPNTTLFVAGNLTVSGTGNCMRMPGGGRVCGNTTCTWMVSPNGNTTLQACN